MTLASVKTFAVEVDPSSLTFVKTFAVLVGILVAACALRVGTGPFHCPCCFLGFLQSLAMCPGIPQLKHLSLYSLLAASRSIGPAWCPYDVDWCSRLRPWLAFAWYLLL